MTDFQSAFYRDVQLPEPRNPVIKATCTLLLLLRAGHAPRATNGRPYTRSKARMQFFDGLFLLPAFSAVFRMLNFPAAGNRGVVHAHPAKSETGHRIAAGTCNPGGKQG